MPNPIDDLLAAYPYDPTHAPYRESTALPAKLRCIDDEQLRRCAAMGWLSTRDGKDWIRARRSDVADDWRNA